MKKIWLIIFLACSFMFALGTENLNGMDADSSSNDFMTILGANHTGTSNTQILNDQEGMVLSMMSAGRSKGALKIEERKNAKSASSKDEETKEGEQVITSEEREREGIESAPIKIALIASKSQVGQNFNASVDAIMAYSMLRNLDFELKVFNIDTEDTKSVQKAYNNAINAESTLIIGIFRMEKIKDFIEDLKISTPLYLPTINKNTTDGLDISPHIYFGGIDYQEQINMLVNFTKNNKIVAYNDNSLAGMYLGELLHQASQNIVLETNVDAAFAKKFNKVLDEHARYFNNSVLFFNTSSIRTGLIISQISMNEKRPIAFLSTQVNFDPVLFDLVPSEFKKSFFIVSAINSLDQELVEYLSLLGRDLRYNWVSYASALWLDINIGSKRYFKENFKDNQIQYNNKIYIIDGYKFEEYK